MVRNAFSGAKRYRRTGGLLSRMRGVTYQNRDYNTKRSKVKFGRKKRRLDAVVCKGLRDSVIRWQACSPSYLGPGYFRLASYENTWLPIHCMSLTNLGLHGIDYAAKGCHKDQGMVTFFRNPVGTFQYLKLQGQDHVGNYASSQWWPEQEEFNTVAVEGARRVFHHWSDVKLNLYGTFSVPITYTVFVMTMKEQVDPFQYSSGSATISEGSETANMLKDMSRNLVGNSVNTNGRQDWWKDVRIIRKERITLQPLSYSDQQAELDPLNVSHTPNIHELRMFIKHNRFRDYKWSENADETVEARDYDVNQWDVSRETSLMCDVEWGKRVFLFVTATCPSRSLAGGVLSNSELARTEGSYDICVRNKFSFEW